MRSSIADRFWIYVDKNGPVRPGMASACWIWTGTRAPRGYGQFWAGKELGQIGAHRFSSILHVGPIPDGMKVCHRCDNPPCVNHEHLFLGTQTDNLKDMMRKGRAVGLKLTPDDIVEIRRLVASGVSKAEAARRFGVSRACARDIASRKRWGHVP